MELTVTFGVIVQELQVSFSLRGQGGSVVLLWKQIVNGGASKSNNKKRQEQTPWNRKETAPELRLEASTAFLFELESKAAPDLLACRSCTCNYRLAQATKERTSIEVYRRRLFVRAL
jgi:hypothetical protein